jgi:hypothetical protein
MKKQLHPERGTDAILNARHVILPEEIPSISLSGDNAIESSVGNSE